MMTLPILGFALWATSTTTSSLPPGPTTTTEPLARSYRIHDEIERWHALHPDQPPTYEQQQHLIRKALAR